MKPMLCENAYRLDVVTFNTLLFSVLDQQSLCNHVEKNLLKLVVSSIYLPTGHFKNKDASFESLTLIRRLKIFAIHSG